MRPVHSSWSFAAWIQKPASVHACTSCGGELEPKALVGPGDEGSRVPVVCAVCAWRLAPTREEVHRALVRAGVGRA